MGDFPDLCLGSFKRLRATPDVNVSELTRQRAVGRLRIVTPQNKLHPMKSSTRDKAVGTAKAVRGKIKESAGRAVGNPRLRDEGTAERAEGKVQKKVGDIKKVFEK